MVVTLKNGKGETIQVGTASLSTMPTRRNFSTDTSAAKACGRYLNLRGESGGWLYTPTHKAVCQGWKEFAGMLKETGIITAQTDGSYSVYWEAVRISAPWFV
jgi:hypothetical protein